MWLGTENNRNKWVLRSGRPYCNCYVYFTFAEVENFIYLQNLYSTFLPLQQRKRGTGAVAVALENWCEDKVCIKAVSCQF